MFTISLVFLTALVSRSGAFSEYPSGWDYFYHKRVLDLSLAQSTLLPYDGLSAGGRTHTYLPGYYSILSAAFYSTGLGSEELLRLSSPAFFALSSAAIFALSGGTVLGVIAALLFMTFPEVLLFSSQSGMPSVAALFLLLVFSLHAKVLAEETGRKRAPFPPFLLLLALSIGFLHAISAVVSSLSILLLLLFNSRNLGRVRTFWFSASCAIAFLVPFLWNALFGISPPSWGLPVSVQSLPKMHLLLFGALAISFNSAFPLALLAALIGLSFFSPLLPSRFLLYAVLPLSLFPSDNRDRRRIVEPPLALVLLSLLLLGYAASFSSPETLKYSAPLETASDNRAFSWIRENVRYGSVVLGHTDFSSGLLLSVGSIGTVIDGFSEGVPLAAERMNEISKAYGSGDFSTLQVKYGAAYLFTNLAEARLLGPSWQAPPGEELFSDGYSKVLKLAKPDVLPRS